MVSPESVLQRLFMLMQSLFYLRRNLIGSLPPRRTNLITCFKLAIIIPLRRRVFTTPSRARKRRCNFRENKKKIKKPRRSGTISPAHLKNYREVTKGRFCIRLIKVTRRIRQHRCGRRLKIHETAAHVLTSARMQTQQKHRTSKRAQTGDGLLLKQQTR